MVAAISRPMNATYPNLLEANMAVDPRTVRLLLTLIAVALFVAIAAAEALEVLHLDAGRAWDAALLLAGALAGQLTLRHSAEPDATEVPGVSFTEGGH